MNENTQIIETKQPGVAELYRRSTDVAGVCREIVLRTVKKIGGRSYIQVEGWQSIATAHGCIPSIREVRRDEDGYTAVAELRRIEDGSVLCTAEGFVGLDEPMWAKRPMYAQKAMSQTRAISRVCRSAFAHVVVLMDAGLSTTPAEEVAEEPVQINGVDSASKLPRGTITQPQLTKLAILCDRVGYSREHLLKEYKLASRTLLSKEHASELIEKLQEKAAEMPQEAPA